MVWTVTSNYPPTSTATFLQNYLNSFSQKYEVFQPVLLQKQWLAQTTYTISLSLTNFLGMTSVKTLTVVVSSDSNLPRLSIQGPTYVTIQRSQILSVKSLAQFSACVDARATSSLQYSWTVQLLTATSPDPSLVSTSNDPTKLLLPAYSLQVGQTYLLTVTVVTLMKQDSSAQSSASASITVFVAKGVVTATITGNQPTNPPSLSPDISTPDTTTFNTLHQSSSCLAFPSISNSHPSPCPCATSPLDVPLSTFPWCRRLHAIQSRQQALGAGCFPVERPRRGSPVELPRPRLRVVVHHRLDQRLRQRLWVCSSQCCGCYLACQRHDRRLHVRFSGGGVGGAGRWTSSKRRGGSNASDIRIRSSFYHFGFHQIQSCFYPSRVWQYPGGLPCQRLVDGVGGIGTVGGPSI